MSEWIKGYQQSCAGANVNYNPSGSGAGVQAFTGGQVAFAGSDSALKPEEHGPADAALQDRQGARPADGRRPDRRHLQPQGRGRPPAVAQDARGHLRRQDQDVERPGDRQGQPGAKLPATPIKPLHRSDDSGTTDNLTKFLLATAPDVWKFEGGKTWPAPAGGQGLKGSDGVSTGVKQGDGTIGYAELSYATNGKLQTAKVANGSGEFIERQLRHAPPRPSPARKVVGHGRRPGAAARLQGQGRLPDRPGHVRDRLPEGSPRRAGGLRQVLPHLHLQPAGPGRS